MFTFTFRQIHGSSWIGVAAVVLRHSYHRSPARLKIKCVSDNYSTNLLLLPNCSINHSKCHTKRSKMHGEHGKFIAYYTQRRQVLCISCAGLHTTTCKIQVPSFDSTSYGYMWVSGVCRYSMKYILLLRNFNLSTLSFTVQFGSSNNISNVYSEGAGLESQLQHQPSFKFFVAFFRLSQVNIKIAPDFRSRLLPSFETPKHHSLSYITYCRPG